MSDRKPKPTKSSRRPANEVLDEFLTEKGIVFAQANFKVEETNTGTLIVSKPSIVVVYEDETKNGEIARRN